MERRLAAILTADAVGYSKLMSEDEAGTLAALKAHRTETFDPAVERHNGRVVKLMGDGVLVEFASVVDAVNCALAIQTVSVEPVNNRIVLRIGINLGDVIIDGDDIYGDGVNVAARLEAIAAPGGICISAIVHESLGNRSDVEFADAGEHQVKNISRPIHVFRWPADGLQAVDVRPSAAGLLDRPAIAVLPFENMSGDPEQEYFADGITEDVITGLSLWRYFPVIARNSTFTYKGRNVEARRIGNELGARYILEGSVRKSNDRVRITAQLIDTETGAHVWADRYDRNLIDIFDLQDEITQCIVTHMVPELGRAEEQRAVRQRPADLGAWDLVQRGCWHYYRFTQADMLQARELLRKSLEIDPTSSLANGFLAATHLFDFVMKWVEEPAQSLADGIEAAQHATTLDPQDPHPYALLATLNVFNREPERGVESGERAVELNPSYALGHLSMGYALLFAGRVGEAIEAMNIALRLSPRDPTNTHAWSQIALAHLVNRDCEAAVECARKAVRENAENFRAYHRLASALGHLGDAEGARKALEHSRRQMPDPDLAYFEATYAFKDRDMLTYFLDGIRKAGWVG